MNMTKRIAAMAVCAAMAATSMISVCVSASDVTVNEKFLISEMGQSASGIMPYAATTKKLTMTVYKQEDKHWCWATCIQMVLDFYGVTKGQEDIVKEVKDEVKYEGGTSAEIVTGLNAFYSEGKFANELNSKSIAFSYIKNKIAAGKPVILTGTLSDGKDHAVVCYGYDTSGSNYVLYIIDPAVGKRGTLTASNSSATSYSMSVSGQTSTSYSTAAYVASKA